MRSRTALLFGIAATLMLVQPARAADEGPLPGYTLGADVSAGYRFVDVEGSNAKYREEYNLQEGPRLFNLDLDGAARAPDTTRLDRFHLEVETPGNEPVQHYRLTAADRSLYDFRADFTRSKYFYANPELFEAPVAGDVRLDDLHTFDLNRTNGLVDLTLHPPNLPTFLFGYRLYDRHGPATSTMFVPAGDVFVVQAPVDTIAHVGRVGTEFRAVDTDVFLQQEFRRVDRDYHRRGPATAADAAGLDPTDASTLDFYSRTGDEHLDIPTSTVRVRRPVGDALELTGAYLYSHAELEFDRTTRRRATSNVPAFSGDFTSQASGGGSFDTHVADAGATLRITDQLRLHTTYRLNDRSQSANLDETSTFGILAAATGDHVRIHSMTTDVEVEPRQDMTLRAGMRYARRDARFSSSGQNIATDTFGAIADARYHPWTFLDLFARYENAQVDDPFVVPGDPNRDPALPEREIALTFTNRARAGFQLLPRDWITLRYELIADNRENGSFAAHTRSFGNSTTVSVEPIQNLTFFASYTRRDLDSAADILLAPVYARTLSLQRGSEDVFATVLRYDFTLIAQPWSTGWDVSYVNAKNKLRPNLEPGLAGRKSFDLDRIDAGAFLTWRYRVIEPSVEFRRIEYNEPALPANDYQATIVLFRLTKHWSW